MDTHAVSIPLRISFDSSLHIGTGRAEGLINRTVRRAADGRPYVPGSALKGALRMTAERLVRQFNNMLGDDGLSPSEQLGYQRRGTTIRDEPCRGPRPETMCQSHDPCIVCRVFGNVFTGTRLHVDDACARPNPFTEGMRKLTELQQTQDGQTQSGQIQNGDAASSPSKERAFSRGGSVDTLTRLSVDRRRQGAKSGALFTSEYSQGTSAFETSVSGELPYTPLERADGCPAELVLLAATIAATDQIGGEATTGHGLCQITVAHETSDPQGSTIVRSSDEAEDVEPATGAERTNKPPKLPAGTFSTDQLLSEETLQALIWSPIM